MTSYPYNRRLSSCQRGRRKIRKKKPWRCDLCHARPFKAWRKLAFSLPPIPRTLLTTNQKELRSMWRVKRGLKRLQHFTEVFVLLWLKRGYFGLRVWFSHIPPSLPPHLFQPLTPRWLRFPPFFKLKTYLAIARFFVLCSTREFFFVMFPVLLGNMSSRLPWRELLNTKQHLPLSWIYFNILPHPNSIQKSDEK